MHKNIKRALFYSYLAVVFYLTLSPGKNIQRIDKVGLSQLLNFENSDKLVHACMFFGFTILYQMVREHTIIRAILIPFSISFLIEILQEIMPFGRTFDWFDLLANLSGILVAIGLLELIKKVKS